MKYSVDDAGWGHVLLGCIIAMACEDFDAPPFVGGNRRGILSGPPILKEGIPRKGL
jgi:hypothetical protein